MQEEQIDKLSNQVKDQEALHKQIYDWKSKFESLSLEFENYRAIHNDDDISDGEVELQDDDRSILSSAKSRKTFHRNWAIWCRCGIKTRLQF